MVIFWSHFGHVLVTCWSHFAHILLIFLFYFDHILVTFCTYFDHNLVIFRSHFNHILVIYLLVIFWSYFDHILVNICLFLAIFSKCFYSFVHLENPFWHKFCRFNSKCFAIFCVGYLKFVELHLNYELRRFECLDFKLVELLINIFGVQLHL